MKNFGILKELVSNGKWAEINTPAPLFIEVLRQVLKQDTGLEAPIELQVDPDDDTYVIYPDEYLETISEDDYDKLIECGYHPEEGFDTLKKLLARLFEDEKGYYNVRFGDEKSVMMGMPLVTARKIMSLEEQEQINIPVSSKTTDRGPVYVTYICGGLLDKHLLFDTSAEAISFAKTFAQENNFEDDPETHYLYVYQTDGTGCIEIIWNYEPSDD